MAEQIYTYRDGKKLRLEKESNQFVVRALPEELSESGFPNAEQVSPSSSRVSTGAGDREVMMSRARGIAPTHHSYKVAETGQEFLMTDRVFVRFKRPLPDREVSAFAGRYGLLQIEAYSDREYLFQLTNHTGINPIKLVVQLTEEEPSVESAEHDLNYRASTYAMPIPSDPSYADQWHLHLRLNHADFDPRASSRCEQAWELLGHTGDSDVVIGVTDDGCKLNHGDFDSAGKFAGWGYFVQNRLVTNADIDADPAAMHQPGANHGTSCAGVIAAEVDALLTVGAAPGCRLLPIKWASSGPSLFIGDSRMLKALNFLANKVDIISNSWGSRPSTLWAGLVKDRIRELARSGGRRGKGIVFLWAAGNENCPVVYSGNVEIPYTNGWASGPGGSSLWVGVETSRVFVNELIDTPGVMHIAALASTAQRSHYSNYGMGVTICAPSSNSHEYWRLNVRGLGITTTTGLSTNITSSFGGTSSATPLVAGIAALVISANPQLSAIEVISLLKRTASKDLNPTQYPRTPAANFDMDTSWDISPVNPFDRGDFIDINDPDGSWSPWFGHGRVDAAKAVAAALNNS